MLIVGREYNGESGRYEYLYVETGTDSPEKGYNSDNRFVYDVISVNRYIIPFIFLEGAHTHRQSAAKILERIRVKKDKGPVPCGVPTP